MAPGFAEPFLEELDPYLGWALRVLQARREGTETFASVYLKAIGELTPLGAVNPARWKRLLVFVLRMAASYREGAEARSLLEGALRRVRDDRDVEEIRTMTNTWVETMWRKGLEEGRQEDRQEGKARTLLRQLNRKFGRLPTQIEERILALRDEAQLDGLLERVLTAGTLDEMRLDDLLPR